MSRRVSRLVMIRKQIVPHVGVTQVQKGQLMKNILSSVKQFLVSEDGPTAVEYAVMLALIVIVCLTAIGEIGTNANTKFGQARDALS